jgi:hypothetical protein
MPLELSLMEEEDVPEFAEVDDAAMRDWGLAKAMENANPTKGPRKDLILEYMQKGFHADSRQTYLKVSDTDTGEMVAAALWRFVLDAEEESPKETPAPGKEVGEKARQDPEVLNEPGVFEGSVMHEMQRQWQEFKDECFPNQPYASMFN